MSNRVTKKETELRVAHAAELVAEGQAYSSITSLVAAKYNISRCRAREITSNAYLLLKDDIEKGVSGKAPKPDYNTYKQGSYHDYDVGGDKPPVWERQPKNEMGGK